MTFRGSIQNRSLDPNSVEKVYLVVWRTKSKRNTLRFGFGGNVVRDKDDQVIGPPIRFLGRESKQVTIICEFPLTGTQDQRLFTEMMPLPGHPNFQINRYTYELAFEDIAGNLFDKDGLPRSMKTLNLRWTLDNAWQRLRDGHPFDFINHIGAIVVEDVRFAIARLFRSIGI
jgi:hypothetical protein